MSSKNEIDPTNLTPEQRQAEWTARAETRERIERGAALFGADKFHAFLTLPEIDLDSEFLHEQFLSQFCGSYRNRQRALEAFLDGPPLATVLRYYLRANEPSGNGVGLNYEAISADFDRLMHAVEMGDRIHVFWRTDISDE